MNTLKTIAASAGLYCAGAVLGLSSALAAIPIQHWTQPSGAQVYLVESPSIPMLDVELDFDAGSRRDPAKQAGLADATALMAGLGVAAKGGQPALDENQLGQAWADLGASFGASAGADRMSFRLRTLTEPDLLAKSVALASRQLGDPSFPEAVWRRERERLSAALREADTRPGTIAGRAFSQAVYGNHPYGYDTTPASLQRIGVADMRALPRLHPALPRQGQPGGRRQPRAGRPAGHPVAGAPAARRQLRAAAARARGRAAHGGQGRAHPV